MPKTKSIKNDGERLVKRHELARLLTGWAQSADIGMAQRFASMRDGLKAELKAEILDELKGDKPITVGYAPLEWRGEDDPLPQPGETAHGPQLLVSNDEGPE